MKEIDLYRLLEKVFGDRSEMTDRWFEKLTKKEKRVIKSLYSSDISSRDCAKLLGMSEIEVREAEKMAILKLRHPQWVKDITFQYKIMKMFKNIDPIEEFVLKKPLAWLNLGTRTHNCLLVSHKCKTVGDVICLSKGTLEATRNFGQISMWDLQKKLWHVGLNLRA